MGIQPKTTLLIVRHGETVWNVEDRYQGHGDSPLTATGRAQARAVGRRLRDMDVQGLVASDLGRTRETAALIAEATRHPVEVDPRLRERHYGVLEGLTVETIRRCHPAVLARLQANDPDYAIPEGESHRQHYRRNVDCIEELTAARAGAVVALVAHGGVLDSVFRYVARLPLEQPRCFVVPNASLSAVSLGTFYGTTRWVIETWGEVGHLAGIGRHDGL
jgi:probable phosphoglycerate mutase